MSDVSEDEPSRSIARQAGPPDPFVAAVRATPMPMVISDFRLADNPLIFVNDAFCRLTGYAYQEVVGRNCRFLQGPGTDPVAIERIRDAIRTARPIEIDIRNYRKDGEPFWNRLLMAPVHDSDGTLAYFFASQFDVTAQRERLDGLEIHNAALVAEAAGRTRALQDGEARLRFATEAGRLGIWELDLGSRLLTTSPLCREIFGRERSAPFGYHDLEAAIHPDDRPRMRQAVEHSIASGTDYDVEIRVVRADGSVGWVQLRAQLVRGADAAPLRMAGTSLDVTQRRAAASRLELSEQSLRLATEAAEIGTWDLDLAANLLTWSDRTKAMFGISPDAPCDRADYAAGLHPEDRDATVAAFVAALDPAIRAAYDVEYRTIGREDGIVRWVASKGKGLFDRGRCYRAVGTAIDITARKIAETRQTFLLALGDRLRDLFDDPDAMLAAATEALARHLGVPSAGYVDVADATGISSPACIWDASSGIRPGAPRLDLLAEYGPTDAAELRAGRVLRLDDLAGRPVASGVRAILAAPVQRYGRTVAFLFAHHDGPHRWSEDDAEILREAAARTWIAVERARAEVALRDLNASLEARVEERTADRDRMWRLSTSAMLVARFDGTITAVNPAWTVLLGWTADQLVGASMLLFVHPDDLARTVAEAEKLAQGVTSRRFENRYRHRDGRYRWLSWTAVPDERFIHAVGQDITAEKEAAEALGRAEEQLRQAQKMEAVGQLTGGIAHDFNNLLTGIGGALELARRRAEDGRLDDLQRYIGMAALAADRAAGLTRRLLAFSRRQPLDPQLLEVNRLVAGMEELLRRTLGPSIELEMALPDGLWPTRCDVNQLESAILNLTINARDAMPDGGRLGIETGNALLDERAPPVREGEIEPGRYVSIQVTDSGTGMDAEVKARAFEPFFTTKPIGRGTGLGLSTLYGFVKQSAGHVHIESEPGRGTVFRLYLPAQEGVPAAVAVPEPAVPRPPSGRGARVLVVDDEEAVRMVVAEALGELGCEVIEARDAASGLRVLHARPLDLLITDLGLPAGLNGRQFADAACAARPALKVLFITGFVTDAEIGDAPKPGMQLLTKPFTVDALLAKVGRLIEQR